MKRVISKTHHTLSSFVFRQSAESRAAGRPAAVGSSLDYLRWYASAPLISSKERHEPTFQEQNRSVMPHFDPSISDTEWRERTEQLLQSARAQEEADAVTPRTIINMEQTIRYWTTQRTPEAVNNCFKLFDLMIQQLHDRPELLKTRDLSYFYTGNYPRATHLLNAVLDAWRIQFELQDKKRMEESTHTLLNPYRVVDRVEHYAKRGVTMNCRVYSIIMQASLCDKHFHKDTPIVCEQLLNYMLQNPHTMPDTVAFTTAIRAWGKSSRPEAAERAEQMFLELVNLYDSNLLQDPPNTVTYNTVLDAMCRSTQRDVMQRAHNLFCDMRSSPYPQVAPNTISYRIMITGWASIQVMDKACSLLHEMVQLYQTGSTDVQLDATFFSKLISILAKSKERQNHIRARELYQVLQRLHQETRDARFSPDELFTTRAMIIVYSKLQQPDLAEALLQRLEKQALRQRDASKRKNISPKRGHYRDVIFAWSKSNDAKSAERAERVLLRMIHVLDAEHELVDKFTVDTVLALWFQQSRKGQADAAQRGESLLRRIQKSNDEKSLSVCQLGRSSYMQVMKGWASSTQSAAPEHIMKLLSELEQLASSDLDMMPTRAHYTIAAAAWMKRKRPGAAAQIRRLLDDAHRAYGQGCEDALPDKALYNTLVHSHAQQGDVEEAVKTLNEMVIQGDLGNVHALPAIGELNLALLACLRSEGNKADVIGCLESIRLLMHQLGLSPNERTKNLLLDVERSLADKKRFVTQGK
ncbi:hypothetical protein MPSEU_000794900 [Mayamaea pseudoterrestris]|nr:hypothetical protein MPSEU_000794900 [Mayamaea pseudoterrestris]